MDLRQSIKNQTDVSLTLAKHILLNNNNSHSNTVFSPLSVHVVLGLITAGSSAQTQKQLLSFLKAESSDDLNSLSGQLVDLVFADGSGSGGPCVSFANGVWIDESLALKPLFKQVVEGVYKAASLHVDFQTKVGWVFFLILIFRFYLCLQSCLFMLLVCVGFDGVRYLDLYELDDADISNFW